MALIDKTYNHYEDLANCDGLFKDIDGRYFKKEDVKEAVLDFEKLIGKQNLTPYTLIYYKEKYNINPLFDSIGCIHKKIFGDFEK